MKGNPDVEQFLPALKQAETKRACTSNEWMCKLVLWSREFVSSYE